MEEVSKECRRGAPWEMLFADDLVLTAESEDEVKDMFLNWRIALERRGLKVNLGKTKLLVSGDKKENEETGRYPCSVCKKGVGSSSIQCSKCTKWVHKRCSGMKTLTNMANFQCNRCTNTIQSERMECRNLEIGDDYIEKVDGFCYLGDMVSSNGGTTDAVRTRQSNVEQVEATIKFTVKQKHSFEDTRHGIPDMSKTSNVLWIRNMGNDKG